MVKEVYFREDRTKAVTKRDRQEDRKNANKKNMLRGSRKNISKKESNMLLRAKMNRRA